MDTKTPPSRRNLSARIPHPVGVYSPGSGLRHVNHSHGAGRFVMLWPPRHHFAPVTRNRFHSTSRPPSSFAPFGSTCREDEKR